MITNTKYGMRPGDVDEALGSQKLREEVVAAGWLKPVIQRHKLTLYNAADVARVWARILAGELPEPKLKRG